MKKNKVSAQLRKIRTREAIEKRRNNKPVDPFASLIAFNKRQNMMHSKDYDYNDEEEQDYGF